MRFGLLLDMVHHRYGRNQNDGRTRTDSAPPPGDVSHHFTPLGGKGRIGGRGRKPAKALLPILPVLAFLPFTLAAFYQARRTASSACCRFLAVRICPKLEDTALVTWPPLNGAFRLSVPRILNTCAISSSLVWPPTRIALAKRTSMLLYRSV